jgi:hypothetical protein
MEALCGALASPRLLRAAAPPSPLAAQRRRRCRALPRALPPCAWSQHHRHHAHAHAHPPPPPPPPPAPPQPTRLQRVASAARAASRTVESLGLPPLFPPPGADVLRARAPGYVAYAAAAALFLLGLRRAVSSALAALVRAARRDARRTARAARAAAAQPRPRRTVTELDGVTLPTEAERAEASPQDASPPQEPPPPNPVVAMQPELSRALLRVSTEDAAAWYLTRLWAVTTLLVVYAQELLTNTTALRP